jgi:UDP-N-acetyl-D-mannosaminuronic acid transferase (WecB/TagA/CpsF family)
VSGHLTPRTLASELAKLKKDVPVYLYGGKPRFLKALQRQLRALGDPRIRLLAQGQTLRI